MNKNTENKALNDNDSDRAHLLELEKRITKKMVGMEQMLDMTLNLHAKMQENLRFWLKQRELDEEK